MIIGFCWTLRKKPTSYFLYFRQFISSDLQINNFFPKIYSILKLVFPNSSPPISSLRSDSRDQPVRGKWETWSQTNASFWKESAICPPPHTWIHKGLGLVSVTLIDSGERKTEWCPSHQTAWLNLLSWTPASGVCGITGVRICKFRKSEWCFFFYYTTQEPEWLWWNIRATVG